MGLQRVDICAFAAVLAANSIAMNCSHNRLVSVDRRAIAETAPAGVVNVVRAALFDRIVAGDIPDMGVVGGPRAKQLYVRSHMPVSKLMLPEGTLPAIPGVTLNLISMSEAHDVVGRTGESLAFITIDRVQVGTDRAVLWLGTDYVAPEQPGTVKLCCCEREALFLRRNDQWVFEQWGIKRCS